MTWADGARLSLDVKDAVLRAERRIRRYVRETPLEPSPDLSSAVGAHVLLKLENLQITGSFKLRGAVNRLLAMTPEERARGVIAASTGNHGLAVAHAARLLRIPCRVFVPETARPEKAEALAREGVVAEARGRDCVETEVAARAEAGAAGQTYVSGYNDLEVVGGQGTIAVELMREMGSVGFVFASVGGGGLISGVGGFLKSGRKPVAVIGCQPERSAVMSESVKAGRIVSLESGPTLSDATAGGVEPGAITLDLCKALVDEWVLVSEDEIRAAMRLVFERHRLVIEGAAGVAVAGLLRMRDAVARVPGANAVVIVCGGNVDVAEFRRLVL
ncbi:MAG: threonine/serine dehydratase [Candidatus Eisenbacteria bacterium]|nr:threonine/serine dehydratase [Candidatus Eisenbacteria bacterium]